MADQDNSLAIIGACANGDLKTILRCLREGVDVNLVEDEFKWTPLLFACVAEPANLTVIETLLASGANVNYADKENHTALMFAAIYDRTETMDLLLRYGADVHLCNEHGLDALEMAAAKGAINAIRILLRHGANLHHQDKDGNTALALACDSGYTEVADLLLQHGANLHHCSSFGWSPLIYAANKGHVATAELLLQRGADITLRDDSGINAASYAAFDGYTAMVELLMRYGDVLSPDEKGWQAFTFAVVGGRTETAEFLLNHGADVHYRLTDGKDALMIAAEKGHTDTVKLLLSRGADHTLQNNDDMTALMLAAANGHQDVLTALLNHGADPTFRNDAHYSALDYAKDEGHDEICRVLQTIIDAIPKKPAARSKQADPIPGKEADKGFSGISGMHELKRIVRDEIIRYLERTEVFEMHGLSIPNGMLLYGPPGCGKTFFCRKFAEEIGCPFRHYSPSDLASPYIHGTPKRIGEIFKEAKKLREEENARMVVLFFDEITTLFGNRADMDAQQSHLREAVDAFLAELNNLGEDDIFVVAATNEPDHIDPAILRAGRFDKKIYVGPPDSEARKGLFSFYSEPRPHEPGIDYDLLAQESKNYTSADIKKVVDDASRKVIKQRKKQPGAKLQTAVLLETLKESLPSLSQKVLDEHERIRQQMQQDND